jgi:site-specific DNA-methyltransferase (adenine-specific)
LIDQHTQGFLDALSRIDARKKKREMTYQILHGNNLDVLPTLADNSIDSIVTDPPYELGFMGKKWDSSGIAYSVELWQQCLRVLKPGGHLLSFGGTRTYHRVAVAIEDAGFELRDSIAWLYGSGFPKSLDVSKAIDKGQGQNLQRQLQFVNWMRTTGLKQQQINSIIGKSDVGSHYLRLDQPAIATADLFDKLRPYLPEVPEEIERLVAERTGIEWKDYKNRKITGEYQQPTPAAVWMSNYGHSADLSIKERKDEASTPEAQQWQGWGTALKPAFEPVIVARKPIEGTVANNVLKWGTGGLNIDGSRIGTETISTHNAPKGSFAGGEPDRGSDTSSYKEHTGRWPANIILDPYTAELIDEQSGTTVSKSAKMPVPDIRSGKYGSDYGTRDFDSVRGHNDSGGASRFFYVAKASKRDRNEGIDLNNHPTVKPTSLMEYLIKLVTPPNGTVLDPFTGSGSTGKAAILQGFDFIGIEMTEEYLPIIEGRLKHAERIVAEAKQQDKAKESEVLF